MSQYPSSSAPEYPGAECLEQSPQLCESFYSDIPESGMGALPPMNILEKGFNWLASRLPVLSAVLLCLIALFITVDVCGRLFFNKPWIGITDLETLFMSVIGFASMAIAIVQRQSIQIDLFYERFPQKLQRILYLFASVVSCGVSGVLAWRAILIAFKWEKDTNVLFIPEWPFVLFR